jgi:hypothetical protein
MTRRAKYDRQHRHARNWWSLNVSINDLRGATVGVNAPALREGRRTTSLTRKFSLRIGHR